ncbi:hypothetical protein KAR91_63250 [Candidatus Pacearchaeota archaeon]|nr:hypothetical protein [Candidatus Pacearchaeota archaeon]
MKILVVGTWNEEKSSEYKAQAEELGMILAKRGHTLVASPSSGFQGLVAQSYKSNGGTDFIGFYPDLNLMKQIGENVMVEPDEKVMTEEDYPVRNLMQIKGSEAVIAVTGGVGTLTESIACVNDYNLPMSYLSGSSPIMDGFLKLDASFNKKVCISHDILSLVEHLEESCSNKN